MKKRILTLLLCFSIMIPQTVFASDEFYNEQLIQTNDSENNLSEENSHTEGCILEPDHEGDCVIGNGDDYNNESKKTSNNTNDSNDEEPIEETTGETNSEEFNEEKNEENKLLMPQSKLMLLKDNQEYIYVSPDEGDDGADGSEDNPVASLSEAVNRASDGDVIMLLDDIILSSCIRISDKNITINGNGFSITRGENFNTMQDVARSTYNPAMLEVTTPLGKGSTLRLENIVLDDAGRHEGTVYAQAISGESNGENSKYVQDAIVAAYGLSNATSTIILGEGAKLKNFGGMSAVRVTGGAELIMESGSEIFDDMAVDRTKSKAAEEETGYAGAIWVQGTKATMNEDSKIHNMKGRAVYVDSGDVTINGEISYINGDSKNSWQGTYGVAVHVRNAANVTLEKESVIDNIGEEAKVESTVYVCEGTLDMKQGSVIKNINGTAIAGTGDASDEPDSVVINMDGEITGVYNGGNALNLQKSGGLHCTIGPNGYIHDNSVWYGSVYIQGVGIHLDFYGKIINNYSTDKSAGICLANNFSGHSVTMYDGAKITGNISKNEAAGVLVSCGTFTMKGGTIADNISSATFETGMGAGVYVRRGGTFIMEGGSIINNHAKDFGGGIYYDASDWSQLLPNVILKGGTISGNYMNSEISGTDSNLTVSSDGKSNDIAISDTAYGKIDRYISISNEMNIGNDDIYIEKNNVTLTNPGKDIKFGNASEDSVNVLLSKSIEKGWSSTELVSLWCQSDSSKINLEFGKVKDLANYNSNLPIYAVAVETDENGVCLGNAQAKFYAVNDNGQKVDFSFDSNSPNGYAVALVQPTENFGTMIINAPEELDVTQNTVIDYSAVYELSQNLKNLIANNGLSQIKFNINIDPVLDVDTSNVTFESEIFQNPNITYNNGVLTITCDLSNSWSTASNLATTINWNGALNDKDISNGKELNASGDFTAVAGNTNIYVPASTAITTLKDLTSIVINPVDITIYMGGDSGADGVVNADGVIEGSNSLPLPGFNISLPKNVSLSDVEFTVNADGYDKVWKAIPYDGSTSIYKLVEKNESPLRLEYTDPTSGEVVVSDEFNVGQMLNKTFDFTIYSGETGNVVANVSNNKTYNVTVGTGKLTVRGTTKYVKYADVKLDNGDEAAVNSGEPAVYADKNTNFTMNDTDIHVDSGSVSLLFDDIINTTSTETDRTELIKAKVNEFIQTPVENNKTRSFDIKYLDLVDADNGNAWVSANNDVTVYWPYPDGTDKNTDFKLLHFEDLHRDMSSNEVGNLIENCNVEEIKNFEKTDSHIKFNVGTAGFSPFALVWEENNESTTDTYKVTYHNGNDTSVYEYNEGEQVTVLGNVFTAPENKVLAGWSLNNDGKVDYEAGDTFYMPGQDCDLYAVWEKSENEQGGSHSSGGSTNYYSLIYHNGDEKEEYKYTSGKKITVSDDVFTAPDGMILAGWSLEDNGEIEYKAGETFYMPSKNYDLYAVWEEVSEQYHKSYITGYPDGTVGPERTITRAEAATMLYNLIDVSENYSKTFTDVENNQWYTKPIVTLASMGVINGYPDGTFRPDESITRAEFVTMAINFAGKDKGSECNFSDVMSDKWHYGFIAGATQNGWISGYPDGTFGPDKNITRAEVASIINRMENRLSDIQYINGNIKDLITFTDLYQNHWAYYDIMEAANEHNFTINSDEKSETWLKAN